ncbi:hypothetical protein APA_3495 [Pseudanabaena sp. lw0831]|nr:hypothetical protein APA_3495 [Pseudanabaena sp. lw0831]
MKNNESNSRARSHYLWPQNHVRSRGIGRSLFVNIWLGAIALTTLRNIQIAGLIAYNTINF